MRRAQQGEEQEPACSRCGRVRTRWRPQQLLLAAAPLPWLLLLLVLLQPGQSFVLLLRPPRPSCASPLLRRPAAAAAVVKPTTQPLSRSPSLPFWSHKASRTARVSYDEEEDAAAVGKLALWELFRELERCGVVYSVLQPREELARLLLDARRGGECAGAVETAGEAEQPVAAMEEAAAPEEAPVAAAAAGVPKAEEAEEAGMDDDGASGATDESRPPQAQRRRRPPASAAAGAPAPVPPPVFKSIADALAWAGKLSKEEISVELDFLGVPQDRFDDEPTHSQLARLLARAVMGEGGPSASPSQPAAAGAPVPPPLPQPKSKARQQRLIRELQREGDEGRPARSRGPPQPLPARRRRGGQRPGVPGAGPRAYGGEERFLDVDHARDELVAMRDRALNAFGGLTGLGPEEGEGGVVGRGGKKKKKRVVRYDAARDRLELGAGKGDLALRVLDKATRVADRALDWATRAKSMARGAMIAATTTDEDVDPRNPSAKSLEAQRKAELQKKSQALLGPRGRRWSKFGGLMARAWAESIWQVVMASASWAGGGLLPGKYVLLGAGAFSLLLRQGLSTYVATLLVVRTCSSTLRNIIEDEEKPAESF